MYVCLLTPPVRSSTQGAQFSHQLIVVALCVSAQRHSKLLFACLNLLPASTNGIHDECEYKWHPSFPCAGIQANAAGVATHMHESSLVSMI